MVRCAEWCFTSALSVCLSVLPLYYRWRRAVWFSTPTAFCVTSRWRWAFVRCDLYSQDRPFQVLSAPDPSAHVHAYVYVHVGVPIPRDVLQMYSPIAAGKSFYARQLAARHNVTHVRLGEVIKEALRNVSVSFLLLFTAACGIR